MTRGTMAGQTSLVAFELTPTEAHMFVKVYGKELRLVVKMTAPSSVESVFPTPSHTIQFPLVTVDKAAPVLPCQGQQ